MPKSNTDAIDPTTTDPEVIWQACQDIANTDRGIFNRFGERGKFYELPELAPVVEEISSFYGRVTKEGLQMLPGDRVHVFAQEAYNVQRAIQDILSLEYDSDQVGDVLFRAYHSTRTELTPFVLSATTLNGSADELKRLSGEAKRMVEDIRKSRDEADRARAATQQVAGDSGVTEYQKVFHEAAEKFAKEKWWGLGALIGLSAGLGFVSIWWVSVEPFPPSDQGWAAGLQVTAGKLFVFGIMSYLVLMAGRAYRAAAHNQIVNEHRRDALKSFRAFVEATSDDATKDAVLVQATHSIFSHRPSGFGHQENDVVPPSHLLELTKSVVGDRGVRT